MDLPSITYALSACHLSYSQLHHLDKPVINAVLSKMGFNCKFPREVVFAPKHFGGIGICHLYCEQGIGQLKQLVSHIRSGTNTGSRFLISIETYQLLAGLSSPILESTHEIPGTRNLWLTCIRKFLTAPSCQIKPGKKETELSYLNYRKTRID